MPAKAYPTGSQGWGSILTQRPDVNAPSPQGFAGHLRPPSAHSGALPLPGSEAPGTAFAAGRAAAARRESVTAPVTGATAAPPPRQLGSSVRAIFKLPLCRSRCLGRKEPAREAGSRAMRPRAEGAAAGAAGECGPRDVGLAGAVPSLPGRSPRPGPGTAGRGPRYRGRRKWGRAGRGESQPAPLPTPLPLDPRPGSCGGRSASWSCLIAPCPARHGRLCSPCRLASC